MEAFLSVTRRCAVAAAGCALVLTFVSSAAAQRHAIGLESESRVSEMLEGNPAGCQLEGASIERSVVVARYQCGAPPSRAVVELAHPDDAPSGAIRTVHFAVVARDGASPQLVSAVAANVRANERGWRWLTVGPAPTRASGWLAHRDVAVVALAWTLLLGWLAIAGARLASRHRVDALVLVALAAVALALRVMVPWGPLDFAEGERLDFVFHQGVSPAPGHAALPILLDGLHRLGVSAATLARTVGPVIGALCVGAVYALARSLGASRLAAVLAAAIVLGLPAHVRYSGSVPLTILAGSLFVAASAVAVAPALHAATRALFVVPALVLLAYSRPESMILLVTFVVLITRATWSRRTAVACALVLALTVGPHLWDVWLFGTAHPASGRWAAHFVWALGAPSTWALIVGGIGLTIAGDRRAERLALLVGALSLGIAYVLMSGEDNPLFGHWRYWLSLAPALAVGAAFVADAVRARCKRATPALAVAIAVVGIGPVALAWPELTRPIDIQTDFHFIRTTGARVAMAHTDLVVLQSEDELVAMETIPLYGLALSIRRIDRLLVCGAIPRRETPRVWSSRALLDGCLSPDGNRRVALYMGIYRPARTVAALAARFRLQPIEERTFIVAPAMQHLNTQCALPETFLGAALPDCRVRLGWYRPIPVSRAHAVRSP